MKAIFWRGVLAVAWSALAAMAPPVHAEPFAYFTQQDGTVQVIDTATNALVKTIAVGDRPTFAAVPAVGQRAYVGTLGSASGGVSGIATVYTASQEVLAHTDLAPSVNPAHLALSSDGNRIYTAGPTCVAQVCPAVIESTLAVFDTRTQTVTAARGYLVQAAAIALDERISRLYVLDALGALLVFRTDLGFPSIQPLARVALPGIPSALALDAVNGRLYAASAGSDSIAVIETSNYTVVKSIALPAAPTGLAVHPAGTPLLVAGGGRVLAYDAGTFQVLRDLALPGAEGVGISPDGRVAYVARTSAGLATQLRLQDLAPAGDVALGGQPRAEGSFIGALSAMPSQAPGPITGLWWNPTQPGWGIHFAQRGSTVFAAWFTYDADGASRWYVAPSCTIRPPLACDSCIRESFCAGDLYEARGPDLFRPPFDPKAVDKNKVGFVQATFHDADHASITYGVGPQFGSADIERERFAPDTPTPAKYTDLWFNALEPGWGIGVTQQGDRMFLAWYVYDGTFAARWIVAPDCAVKPAGGGCIGRLYRASGPFGPASGAAFDPSRMHPVEVGAVDLTFLGPNDGVLRYEVDGRRGTKVIVRQVF